jgi:hypothetical protein
MHALAQLQTGSWKVGVGVDVEGAGVGNKPELHIALQLSPGQMTVGGMVGTTGFQHDVQAGHCTATGNSGAQ